MLEGEPLSARLLAVAAADIYWWHGDGTRQIVNRAVGDAKPVPGLGWTLDTSAKPPVLNHTLPAWMFLDAPQNGIVLSHLAIDPILHPVTHNVTSECRDHANLFTVEPNQVIKVQVNSNLKETTPRTGSYGLWVKVIE